jgi:hypothetical protein
MQAKEYGKNTLADSTGRMGRLEDQYTASSPSGGQAAKKLTHLLKIEIARLKTSLTVKNNAIKEKNSALFLAEQTKHQLQENLVAEMKKNKSSARLGMGGSVSGSSKATHPAQKKRRHADIKGEGGDEDNPWVI